MVLNSLVSIIFALDISYAMDYYTYMGKTVMLAAKFDPDLIIAEQQMKEIRFPVLASHKIDGIRGHGKDGVALSRKDKPLPNRHLQKIFGNLIPRLDGEFTCGLPTSKSVFNTTQSAVMSQDGEPLLHYHVFDYTFSDSQPFYKRLQKVVTLVKGLNYDGISYVPHEMIYGLDDLLIFEEKKLADGWEGIMMRDPMGPYKWGRSTLTEGYLIKLKRFQDSEAEILGVYEQETNTNEAKINEVGRSKRSSHKDGKLKNGHLGGFVVRDLYSQVEFEVGTMLGVTKEDRFEWWQKAESFIGKIIKYKFLPIGVKVKPRSPIFLGFRSPIDI